MRDVDARHAASSQVFESHQQDGDFVLAEGRGGFVEDEDASVLRECFDDFDELFVADAQFAHHLFGRDRDFEPVEELTRLIEHGEVIDQAVLGWLAPQENILRHRHVVDQSEFLINHGNARCLRVRDRAKLRWFFIDEDFAFVRTRDVDA